MKKIALLIPTLAIIMSMIGASSAALADTASSSATNTVMMTDTASGKTVEVDVMTHLCNANIKNMSDFQALEAGKSPVAALANTVLNCPTTGLPNNAAATGTVASPRTNYNFTVMGEHGSNMMLADSSFMQHKLSEADINVDVDGNGTISSSTALDISHYEFKNINADNGRVTVTESTPPAGFHFGTIRFTPNSLIPNNDKDSFLSTDEAQGRIQLDMSHDTDKTVMLHVYNFRNADGDQNNNGTSTNNHHNDRGSIINQIHDLQAQIQHLFAEIQNLLARL